MLALPLVLLGGVTAPRHAEAAAPPLNWTYRDRVHKFSMKMLRDYKAVPLKTDEKTTVCKFRDPKSKGAMRGSYPITIEVVRVSADGQNKPVITGGGDGTAPTPQTQQRELWDKLRNPTDVWTAMIASIVRWGLDMKGIKALEAVKPKSKAIKSKDKVKVPGKLWQFVAPIQSRRGSEKIHVTVAEFSKGGWSYGLIMTCGTRLEKSYAKAFKKIATSFKWADTKAKDVESLDRARWRQHHRPQGVARSSAAW